MAPGRRRSSQTNENRQRYVRCQPDETSVFCIVFYILTLLMKLYPIIFCSLLAAGSSPAQGQALPPRAPQNKPKPKTTFTPTPLPTPIFTPPIANPEADFATCPLAIATVGQLFSSSIFAEETPPIVPATGYAIASPLSFPVGNGNQDLSITSFTRAISLKVCS